MLSCVRVCASLWSRGLRYCLCFRVVFLIVVGARNEKKIQRLVLFLRFVLSGFYNVVLMQAKKKKEKWRSRSYRKFFFFFKRVFWALWETLMTIYIALLRFFFFAPVWQRDGVKCLRKMYLHVCPFCSTEQDDGLSGFSARAHVTRHCNLLVEVASFRAPLFFPCMLAPVCDRFMRFSFSSLLMLFFFSID